MESASVEQCWDRLDPAMREWFINNPGTVILPRTVANAVNAARGDGGRSAQLEVSEADRGFIREMAQARRNAHRKDGS